MDLIEKLARLVCYRRSAKPEDNDYRLYQEIGRYLQDKIESRVGV